MLVVLPLILRRRSSPPNIIERLLPGLLIVPQLLTVIVSPFADEWCPWSLHASPCHLSVCRLPVPYRSDSSLLLFEPPPTFTGRSSGFFPWLMWAPVHFTCETVHLRRHQLRRLVPLFS